MTRKLFLILLVSFSTTTFAQTNLPVMEGFFGATTTNAAAGNNGLTVGVSKYGEVVNLKWPFASYYDHINYKSLEPIPFGWQLEDYNRFHNAEPLKGSFAGIEYKIGNVTTTTWLRDSDWIQKQYYLTDVSPVIVTEYSNTALQLQVKSIDFVPVNQDAFVRKFVIQWADTNLIQNAKIIFSSSMAPCNKNSTFNPEEDWKADQNNGFANAYHSVKGEFVSFIPNASAANTSLIPTIFASQTFINNFIDNLNTTFPSLTTSYNPTALLTTKDIYVILGANRMPIAHGMLSDYGFAQTMPANITPNLQSISNNAAQLYSIYKINLTNSNNTDSINYQFSFGPTYQLAQNLYDSIFTTNHTTLLNNTLNYWNTKLSTATLPNTGDAAMQKTLKRMLVNALISTNRNVGGLSSSVCSTQPPYTQAWTRDNAMTAFMLNCAGYTSEAEKAAIFFANNQRLNDGDDCKTPSNNECYAGTWFQCYYADGRPSWEYDFEIDLVGWGVWMMQQHGNFLSTVDKTNYLNSVYASIKRGANFLKDFRDPNNFLQLTAREDDVLWQNQTIYGAATTLMGLKSAVAAGTFLNDTASVITAWQNRITELETAIQTVKWGLQGNQYDVPAYNSFGPFSALIWPALLKDTLNSQMLSHADSLQNQIAPFFAKTNASMNKEWWYVGKTLTSLSYLWRSNPSKRPIVENYLKTVLKVVPTEGTLSYGESVMIRDLDSLGTIVRKYDNRVGQPMNFPAACFYVAAEMLYGRNHDLYNNVSYTAVNETNEPFSFTIYPNPTNGQFTILLPVADNVEIIVTDILGQQVLKTKSADKKINLQLNGQGVYIVYVATKQGTTSQKIIVNQ